MQGLTKTDTAARALAVAEALDCSSHRLDAWATPIVSERRAQQAASGARRTRRTRTHDRRVRRRRGSQDRQPRHGRRVDPRAEPAARHRSRHASQLAPQPPAGIGAGGDGGPFAIDLSSRRMQSAAHVIDGVRQGQQLGALVGYQIERGLAGCASGPAPAQPAHDRPAGRPPAARRDGADARAAQESVAATNVVDGVLLLKRHAPGDPALRARSTRCPQNVYLDAGDWDPLTNAEWTAVTRIMREARRHDRRGRRRHAQRVGAPVRRRQPAPGSAAMDAMSTGASPSDTIDVLEAQDSGERLTPPGARRRRRGSAGQCVERGAPAGDGRAGARGMGGCAPRRTRGHRGRRGRGNRRSPSMRRASPRSTSCSPPTSSRSSGRCGAACPPRHAPLATSGTPTGRSGCARSGRSPGSPRRCGRPSPGRSRSCRST